MKNRFSNRIHVPDTDIRIESNIEFFAQLYIELETCDVRRLTRFDGP